MEDYKFNKSLVSNYITPEGEKALRDELHYLWKVERPKTTSIVHEAAKNGDRSENGDYIYGKKRLREIDKKVSFITKRLEELIIISTKPKNKNKIYFGAWVTFSDENDHIKKYRIVGPDEFDLNKQKISIDSPLAKALIGKEVNDEIIFKAPSGKQKVVITSIHYD